MQMWYLSETLIHCSYFQSGKIQLMLFKDPEILTSICTMNKILIICCDDGILPGHSLEPEPALGDDTRHENVNISSESSSRIKDFPREKRDSFK